MNRGGPLIVRVLLGAMAFVFIAYVALFVLFLVSTAGPDPEEVLARAQPLFETIPVALAEYRRTRGNYPAELSDLVEVGLLAEVPEVPAQPRTMYQYPLRYETSAFRDLYQLSFGYVVESGCMLGHRYFRVFRPDNANGWETRRRGVERWEDVVEEPLFEIYRKRRDATSLHRFMTEVVIKRTCGHLSETQVKAWLGDGIEINVPHDVLAAGETGYVYQAEDDASWRYCFVYKDRWLPVRKSLLAPEERAKYPADDSPYASASIEINYPVLDKLFWIQEVSGRSSWKLLRECPESPRDKPSHRSLEKAR